MIRAEKLLDVAEKFGAKNVGVPNPHPSFVCPHHAAMERPMDILYCTSWLYAANRQKADRTIALDHLPSTSGSSSVARLLLAVAIVAAIVGVLGHAANSTGLHLASSTTQPTYVGTPK